MKRLLSGLLITTILFSLVSCGNESCMSSETLSNGTSETGNSEAITDQTEETDKAEDMGKTEERSETEDIEMQGSEEIRVFNFETKTVTLNSGYEMPLTGLVYRLLFSYTF